MTKFWQHLDAYTPWNEDDAKALAEFRTFLAGTDNPFGRTNLDGHITASAWVVDPALSQTLLVDHIKLKCWLMPGGHADGNDDVLAMARQEVLEETGLADAALGMEGIFDIDVHPIPEAIKNGKVEPPHFHYDVRYLLIADPKQEVQLAPDESNGIQWVALEKVRELEPDWTDGLRMVEKTEHLRQQAEPLE